MGIRTPWPNKGPAVAYYAATAALLVLTANCSSGAFSQHLEPVDMAELQFEHPAEKKRFDSLQRCFADKTATKGFEHVVGKIYGEVGEYWCRGSAGLPICEGSTAARQQPGAQWYHIGVLHDPLEWPKVAGLVVAAGSNPTQGRWGVEFSYRGRDVMPDKKGFELVFSQFQADQITLRVRLSDSYEVPYGGAEPLRLSFDMDQELKRLTASAKSLRDTALAHYEQLNKLIVDKILSPELRKLDCPEFAGGEVPDSCNEVPLTVADQRAILHRFQPQIRASRKAIEDGYSTLYEVLNQLLSFDKCWR